MQTSNNAPYLKNEHGDPPFFAFLAKVDHYVLRGKFKKNLYVGTFWAWTFLKLWAIVIMIGIYAVHVHRNFPQT